VQRPSGQGLGSPHPTGTVPAPAHAAAATTSSPLSTPPGAKHADVLPRPVTQETLDCADSGKLQQQQQQVEDREQQAPCLVQKERVHGNILEFCGRWRDHNTTLESLWLDIRCGSDPVPA
jgi:hypothetical protein